MINSSYPNRLGASDFSPTQDDGPMRRETSHQPTWNDLNADLLLEISPFLQDEEVLSLSLASSHMRSVLNDRLTANQRAWAIRQDAGPPEARWQRHLEQVRFARTCREPCATRTVLTALAECVHRNPLARIGVAWHHILDETMELSPSLRVETLEALMPWEHVPQEQRWSMFSRISPLALTYQGDDFYRLFNRLAICLDALSDECVGPVFGLLLGQVNQLAGESRLYSLGLLMLRIGRVPPEQVPAAFDVLSCACTAFAGTPLQAGFLHLLVICQSWLPESHFREGFDRVMHRVESLPEEMRAEFLLLLVQRFPGVPTHWQSMVAETIEEAVVALSPGVFAQFLANAMAGGEEPLEG